MGPKIRDIEKKRNEIEKSYRHAMPRIGSANNDNYLKCFIFYKYIEIIYIFYFFKIIFDISINNLKIYIKIIFNKNKNKIKI